MNRIFPKNLEKHWKDTKGLIQVVVGPRQVGKTTRIIEHFKTSEAVYASADTPAPPTVDFIIENWEKARQVSKSSKTLVLDEIQKIPRWSEVVKKLWDEDKKNQIDLNVWLLGSSAILIEKGLSESLTGRFELNSFPHWTFHECNKIFGATLEEYLEYGGYPKAYAFRDDHERWMSYLQDSIIETTLGRDILTLHSVEKPALLRQLFWYVSKLPARILSFEKILGHLQGKGNSATLVHYADLLKMAFIALPLSKYSSVAHRVKQSQPKWIIPNPALVDPSIKVEGFKDFVFENLVGSHLANLTFGSHDFTLQYWREDDLEVDFIVAQKNKAILAIEVKSGRVKKRQLSASLLESYGIDCPQTIIHPGNVKKFLCTDSVEEIVSGF